MKIPPTFSEITLFRTIYSSLTLWTTIKTAIVERAKRINSPWNSWRRIIGRFSGSCHFAVSTRKNRHACIPIETPSPLLSSFSFTLSSPASSASDIISRVPLFSSIIGLIWASSDKSGALVISNRYSGGGGREEAPFLPLGITLKN